MSPLSLPDISPASPRYLRHLSEVGRCYGQFNNQLALLVHALAAAAAMGRVIWGRYGGDMGEIWGR
jgi:hypothetical protein